MGSTSADGNLNTGSNDSSANGQRTRPGQEPHNVIFGANMTDQIVRGTYEATPPRSAWLQRLTPPRSAWLQRLAPPRDQMPVKLCIAILIMGSALMSSEFSATIGCHYPIVFPLAVYLLLLYMTHTAIFLVIFFTLVI